MTNREASRTARSVSPNATDPRATDPRLRRTVRAPRGFLLASTALCAVVLSLPMLPRAARAQMSPTTVPTGGQVVVGSASIATKPGQVTIDQTSQRAGINWQSFNVGSQGDVRFNQPNASAVALNRVISAEPSTIAGHIEANGQIVLINQSGVVFAGGSDINAGAIVASTSNISNEDFAAGRMNFTGAPKPGASIVNEGRITVHDAGLAAFVAPQVSNSGVIVAKLGHVVLAGASAFTLDLYGDRLISLDVTREVRAIDLGGKQVPALVTNTGTILADGGSVRLTASAADHLIQTLLQVGGTVRADSVGSSTGAITLDAVGGDITIAGAALARGQAAGTAGGSIQALASGAVSVASGAVVDASGDAGGGVIALGTDLARARQGARQGAADTTAPESRRVAIAAGATVRAAATGHGNGGTITVLSRKRTASAGTLDVRGGAASGNGGTIEVSTDGVLALSGTVLDTAAHGAAGSLLLDPNTLIVGGTTATANSVTSKGTTTIGDATQSPGTSEIDAATLDTLTGTVILQGRKLVEIDDSITNTLANAFTIIANNGDVNIDAAVSLAGGLEISANGSIAIGAALNVASLGIADTGGAVDEVKGGAIVAGTLSGSAQSFGLLGTGNDIGTLGGLAATNGGFALAQGQDLVVAGPVTAAGGIDLLLSAATLTIAGALGVDPAAGLLELGAGAVTEVAGGSITAGTLISDGAIAGNVALGNANSIATLGAVSAGTLALNDTGLLTVDDAVSVAAGLSLTAGTLAFSGATITAGTFGASVAHGDLALDDAGGSIGTLGGITVSHGDFGLTQAGSLTVAGPLDASDATISLGANPLTLAAAVSLAAGGTLALGASAVTQTAGTIVAGTLLSLGTIAGAVALGDANSIGALGSFDAGALTLGDTGGLVLDGPVSIANLLSFTGNVSLSGTTEIDAGTLALTVGTNAVSLSGTNSIAALGPVTAAALTLNDTAALAVDGAMTVGGLLDLAAHALTFNTGSVTAGTLGVNAASGDVSLADTAGSVGTLDGITVSAGNFSFSQAADLALAGDIGATTLSLDAGALTQASGVITAGALVGSMSGAASLGDANSIATLGAFDASALTLHDSGSLDAAGPVSIAGLLSLSSSSLAFGGDVNAGTLAMNIGTGAVSLDDAEGNIGTLGAVSLAGDFLLSQAGSLVLAGNVALGTNALTLDAASLTQASGTVTAGTLAGSLSGAASLADANSIGALGTFNAGALTLNDTGTLAVGGPVSIAGLLSLSTNGAVSGTGAVSAGTLAADTNGADFSLTGSNAIGILGAMDIGAGTLALADTALLDILGPVDAASAGFTLAGASIAPTASLSIASLLDFTGSAGVTGTGTIQAGTLAGSLSAGALSLTGSNTIGTLGTITDQAGAITLDDASALTSIVGAIDAAGVTLALRAASLAAGAEISVSNTLALTGTNTISGTGTVIAPVLDASLSAGDLLLTGDANTIAALGSVGVPGTVVLHDTGLLSATGTLDAADATLASSGTVAVGGALGLSTGGTLALVADHITIGSGVGTSGETLEIAPFAAPTLALGTGTDLPGTGVGGFGTLVLGQAAGSTAGTVIVSGAFAPASATLVSIVSAGPVSIDNTIALGLGTLALMAGGAVSETGGAVVAGLLDGSGGADVILGSAANQVNTLALSLSGGTLDVADAGTLAVSLASAADVTLAAQSIAIGGLVSAANTLSLDGGGVSEAAAGTVNAGTLIGSITAADLLLASAHNDIGAFGTVAVSNGTLVVADTAMATIAGAVSATAATLDLAGATLAPGALLSAANTLDLVGTGTQGMGGSGTVDAGTLTGSLAGGDFSFGGTANAVGTIGDIADGNGTITLADTRPATFAGQVRAEAAGFDLAGATLAAGSGISVGGALDIHSGATISGPGAVEAGTLLASLASGGLLLSGTQNAIPLLGAISVPGEFLIDDTEGLAAPSAVSAGTFAASLASGSLLLQGANTIPLLGAITVPGEFLIDDAEGLAAPSAVSAGTFAASLATGDLSLTGVNAIGTLGAIADNAGTLVLSDASSVAVAGSVSAAASTLALAGASLAAGSQISVGGMLDLLSTGPVSGPGAVAAGTLAASLASGGLVLSGAQNAIPLLGAITVPGEFLIDDTEGLSGASPIAAGTLAASLATGNLLLSGTNTIPLLGAVTVPGEFFIADMEGLSGASPIAAGTLAAAIAAGNLSVTGANAIGTLGAIADDAGTLSLVDTTPATVAGPVQAKAAVLDFAGARIAPGALISIAGLLDIASGQAVTGAGAVDAGTLAVSLGEGDFSLTGTANAIGTLGAVAVPGNLTLTDAAGLLIAGPASVGGTLALTAPAIDQSGSRIVAAELDGAVAGGATFDGASNAIAALGSFSAATLRLADTAGLAITGPVSVPGQFALRAAGIAESGGGEITAGTLVSDGGASGGVALGGANAIGTLGSFTANGGFLLNDDIPLTLVGPLTGNPISLTVPSLLLAGTGGDGIISGNPNTQGTIGIMIDAAGGTLEQSGTFGINTSNGAPGTLTVDSTGDFTGHFSDLLAPSITMVLNLQQGGTIRPGSEVHLANLFISGAGQGSVQFIGTIDGTSGAAAAGKGSVSPFPQSTYQFNGCPVGTANCQVLPIESVPQENPLNNFNIRRRERRALDPNIELPGIATRDY